MRLLLQRVTHAEVQVDGQVVGSIGGGLLAFVGVGHSDTSTVADAMALRTLELRIFRDEAGRTNRSLADVGGEVLAISQFTLYADTRKGRRPSFLDAAPATLGAEQVFALHAAPGFLPSADIPATPTPHALPFAQAPPAPIV